METTSPAIRSARPADAMGIGLVHVRSWQAAYRGQVPDEYLDHLDPAARGEFWRGHLDQGLEPPEGLIVADVDGQVVGFSCIGPARDGDHEADGVGEVRAIYLAPEQWDRGTGRTLMQDSLRALASFGFVEATLWVLDSNHRARRFYEAGGWAADGATKVEHQPGFSLCEVRYRRTIP